MSPSTIDRPALEDRIRTALAHRAHSTDVEVPDRFTPTLTPLSAPHSPARQRRQMLLVAAALVVIALGVAALATRTTSNHPDTEGGVAGTPVEGPTGSRWLVLDLPGLTGYASRSTEGAWPDVLSHMQAFRTEAGFDGPALWLDPGGSGRGTEGATPVDLSGTPAYLREEGNDVATLYTRATGDEGGFIVTATHVTTDDLVAFADGLEPRSGGGWNATVLPQGMAEIDLGDPARPASETYEATYFRERDIYSLSTYAGGTYAFEWRASDHVASGDEISVISVDGRPGVLIESGSGDAVALWRPTDDVVANFRSSLGRDDLLAAMEALVPTDEAGWEAHFDTLPYPTAD